MKKYILITIIIILFEITRSNAQNIGISDVTHTPNTSAVLDVYSTSKGLLVPRVTLASTADSTTVASPVASLLVYNIATAGDVTPGYYYRNSLSKWVRLLASSDPDQNYNTVTKSSNTTLLKTEDIVLASGNITLTLPSVTVEDNGLEITIKNIGTHTDLVNVLPQAGKTLDADTISMLSRWEGKTYVAYDGNWLIKERNERADNMLEVSKSGSFTTVAEALEFLNDHMSGPTVIRLGAGSYEIAASQTINLPYPLTILGISYGETTIDAADGVSGSPLFICETECYFKMLTFNSVSNAAGNDAIHFTGSGNYHEVKDCYFVGFNKGIVSTNNNELWIFETDFEDCAGAGIVIAAGSASDGFLKISEADFMQCAIGIDLLSGVSETISILNCTFYNTISGSGIGVLYHPNTFSPFSSMFITNNAWNNEGTFVSGFDFSRTDGRDANAFLINNAGMQNESPHCKINVSNNSSTTTIANNGTFVKANWTNAASSSTCKWTLENNKMKYQSNNATDVWCVISGNISVTNQNRVITIAIVKNGISASPYGETDLRITVQNQPFQFSTVIYVPNMKKDDYLELWTTSNTSSDVVTFQDVQWFANTQ